MTSSTQPGWYDDPEDANGQRYWDGQAWTPHRQQKPVSQAWTPSLPPPQPAPAPSFGSPAPQLASQPPGYPPARPKPHTSSVLARIGGGVLAVFVVLFFGHGRLHRHHHSPEDQIRNVVQGEVDDWNKFNFSYDPAVDCKQDLLRTTKNRLTRRAKTSRKLEMSLWFRWPTSI